MWMCKQRGTSDKWEKLKCREFIFCWSRSQILKTSAVETEANFIHNVFRVIKSASEATNVFQTGREKLVTNKEFESETNGAS